MSLPSRRSVISATASIASAGLAGCSSNASDAETGAPTETSARSPEQDTPSPPYQFKAIDDAGERIDAAVEVHTKSPNEVVWADTYELDDGERRTIDVQIEPGEYVLQCWMPDGPVETLFGHEWSTATEPSLQIRFHAGGIEFESRA
ncbi:MAG: hypothetical protein ABEH81_06735 [Halopenitus sp.]